MTVAKWIIPVVSIVVMATIILYSLNKNVDVRLIVCMLIGLIIIILGNYMPKTKPNSVMGMKNKWTRNDESVWKKGNRVFGHVMVIFGFLFIISAFMEAIYSLIVLVAFILIMLIVTAVYSYYLSRKASE